MHITVDISESPSYDWNQFLLKSEIGNIMNTIEYSEYALKWLNWNPIFFRLVDSKGNVILQNLFFEYDRPLKKIPFPLRKIYQKLSKSIRWNYGPINSNKESLDHFFNYLENDKRRIYGTTHPLSKLPSTSLEKQKWSTFLIYLHKNKNELYESLEKNSARKNIERAIERKVSVEEITDKTLDEYHKLLKNYKIKEGGVSSLEEMRDFWSLLKKVGFSGFLARKDGIPIGGLTFSYFNKYINEWGVARSETDTQQKLYSQDLIKWKVIEWGSEHNMNWFDLSGFNPAPSSKKEEGLFRYKKKWGGTQYDYWIIRK